MSGSVNKVILVGNLGKDPEVRTTQNGSKVVNLTLATSENWTDKASGERKERTEWHRVVIFNDNLVKVAESYLRKGSKVYIEGALTTRKFQDKTGAERETTEVVLQKFRGELTMLDGKGEGGGARDGGEFGGYSATRAGKKLEQISDEVDQHDMPLKSYTWMHPEARLTPEEVRLITDWADALRDQIAPP